MRVLIGLWFYFWCFLVLTKSAKAEELDILKMLGVHDTDLNKNFVNIGTSFVPSVYYTGSFFKESFPTHFTFECILRFDFRGSNRSYNIVTLTDVATENSVLVRKTPDSNIELCFFSKEDSSKFCSQFAERQISDGVWHKILIRYHLGSFKMYLDCSEPSYGSELQVLNFISSNLKINLGENLWEKQSSTSMQINVTKMQLSSGFIWPDEQYCGDVPNMEHNILKNHNKPGIQGPPGVDGLPAVKDDLHIEHLCQAARDSKQHFIGNTGPKGYPGHPGFPGVKGMSGWKGMRGESRA